MKSKFQFHRPADYREACELKQHIGKGAVYWSGGTDLMGEWQSGEKDIEHCIDITRIGLNYLKMKDSSVHIGATLTLDELASATAEYREIKLLSETAKKMATPQVRTIATVGGNICNGLPSADLAAPFMALNTDIVTTSGTHKIEDFYNDVRNNVNDASNNVNDVRNDVNDVKNDVLGEDDLALEFVIPLSERCACSYKKSVRSTVGVALAGAAVFIQVDDKGIVSDVRIALSSVAPVPVIVRQAGQFLTGIRISEINDSILQESAEMVVSDIRPITDLRGSKEFRRYATVMLTKSALSEAVFDLQKRDK